MSKNKSYTPNASKSKRAVVRTTTKTKPTYSHPAQKYKGNQNNNKNKMDTTTTIEKSKNKIYDTEELWSKSKKKRMRKMKGFKKHEIGNHLNNLLHENDGTNDGDDATNQKKQKKKEENKISCSKQHETKEGDNATNQEKNKKDNSSVAKSHDNDVTEKKKKGSSSSILESYKKRLTGARFRTLNEDLYTNPSKESFEKFSKNPEIFEQYHVGFRNQVKSWPQNPVDIIIQSIISYYKKKHPKKQKKGTTKLVIADFGCGDAKIASTLAAEPKYKEAMEIHSFDFVTNGNTLITQADMSNVPLPNDKVDIGIICLALMGTNIPDFIREAYRVLKPNGLLKIAEVRSRFESTSSNNDQENDDAEDEVEDDEYNNSGLKEFLRCMTLLGFKCTFVDRSNKMFFIMEFMKMEHVQPSMDVTFTAKPCIYKRR